MDKELSINMHMYMKFEGEKSKEELEEEFSNLMMKIVDEYSEYGLDFQIHETEIQ